MDLAASSAEVEQRRSLRAALGGWGDRDRVLAVQRSPLAFDPGAAAGLAAGWFGAGTPASRLAGLMEEIGYHPMPGPFLSSVVHAGATLKAAGAELAGAVASGQRWAAVCSGGDLRVERRRGDWHVHGTVGLVPFGRSAGVLVVVATAAGDAGGVAEAGEPAESAAAAERGTPTATVVVIDAGAGGVTITDQPSLGRDATAEITFENVVAPARSGSHLAGGALAGAGDLALVAQAGELVGTGQAALDIALAWVGQRRQWDRPLAALQTVQHRLVDLQLRIDQARLATADAAGRAELGLPAGAAASGAKVLAVEAALAATAGAHQLHGGEGYYEDRHLGLFYRRARALAPRLGGRADQLRRIRRLSDPPAGSRPRSWLAASPGTL